MPKPKPGPGRSEIVGQRVGYEPASEAEHFIRCRVCGGGVDMGDLAQVFDHEGALAHPAQDRAH